MTAPKTITLRRGWTPVPRGIVGKNGNAGNWPKSWAQHRLLEVIAEAIKFDGEAMISNIDLMHMASLDKDTLPQSRKELVKLGWITARPIDGKRKTYKYTLLEPTHNEQTDIAAPAPAPADDETEVVRANSNPIPARPVYVPPANPFGPGVVNLSTEVRDTTEKFYAFVAAASIPNLEGRKPNPNTNSGETEVTASSPGPAVVKAMVDTDVIPQSMTRPTQLPPPHIPRAQRQAAAAARAAAAAEASIKAKPNFPPPPRRPRQEWPTVGGV